MSSTADFFSPPAARHMKVLDRSFFHKKIELAAAQVEPRSIPIFKQHYILDQSRLRSIYDHEGQKVIALRPEIRPTDLSALDPSSRHFIVDNKISVVPFSINLDYSYWSADEILASILPEELVAHSPAGFTAVGHIAHMNIREEYLPFKNLVGEVILDKNKSIQTVVNKLDTIDSVYRNFQMEVLAGKPEFLTEHGESGCKFRFDFSKVYWNSRLHTEHERLIALFEPGQAVCDVMAGVGPFAVPAGKKNVIVYANDLNPASYEALVDNIDINHVSSFVLPSNQDGRTFIKTSSDILQQHAQRQKTIQISARPPKRRTKPGSKVQPVSIAIPHVFQHYVMNLPASAIEFLDAFRGLYKGREDVTEQDLPTIHVHCFTKFEGEEALADMLARINSSLSHELEMSRISYHLVRRVAPNKDMYCCSFVLPASVAFEA